MDEEIDFLTTNHDEIMEELEEISKRELLKIEINEGLETALKELQELKDQWTEGDCATLLELCKDNVIETITGQFGLASLFVDARDGGSVTTSHNFKKGIVASDADKQKYDKYIENNSGQKDWNSVRKGGGYDDPLPGKRKAEFQTKEVIIDAYTGKELPKDGRAHLDHVVSAKEIESNHKAHLFLSPEERAQMATQEANLAWTSAPANQSKGDKDLKKWVSQEDKKTGLSKAEKFGIDEKKALEVDKTARRAIKGDINKAAIKKYSTELLQTGGKDAAKMAAYSALGVVLRDLVQGVMIEIRVTFQERGNESFKQIFERFKKRLAEILEDLKHKWKDIFKGSLEAGLMAFLSNILVFIINLVASTLKKMVSMIRAGFVSLVQAVKILANPPAGMSIEDVRFQALKVLTAGLIGAASMGLSAGIEKLLQSIPGLGPFMMFPIPSIGSEPRTISDILAVTFSALAGGVLTTIVLYFLDKIQEGGKKTRLQIQLVNQSGVVVNYKIAQTWFALDDGYRFLAANVSSAAKTFTEAGAVLIDSSEKTDGTIGDFEKTIERLRKIRNE